MHTRLKWIALRSFRSFVERTVINFPTSGVVPVRGFNLDTGGSSGAGKSSVNLAVAYALGICPFPATALQSWLTEVPLLVELCLETGEGEVIVTRGEQFSVSVNGEVTKGSAKAVDERLQRVLGLPLDLIEALTYRKQLTRGQFLSKSNSEKQDFLTLLLGLEKFDAAIEKTQAHIKNLEPLVDFNKDEVARCEERFEKQKLIVGDPALVDEIPLRKEVLEIESKIKDTELSLEAVKASIVKAEAEIQAATDLIITQNLPILKSLELQIEAATNEQLPEIDFSEETRLQELQKQAREFLVEAVDADEKVKDQKRTQAWKLQGELDKSRKDLDRIDQFKTNGQEVLHRIEILEKNTCPTCSQQWAQAKEEKAKLELELEKIANDLQELQLEGVTSRIQWLEKAIQETWQHKVNPDIEKLRSIGQELDRQISEERARIARDEAIAAGDKQEKIADLKTQFQASKAETLQRAQNHQAASKERLNNAYEEIDALQATLKSENSRLQGCKNVAQQAFMKNSEAKMRAEFEVTTLVGMEKALADSRLRLREVAGRLTAEKDFLLLVGREGFLGSIFDEVLWEISSESNRILSSIPNTAHMTINFRSESTTQKGKINKQIVPVVTIGGFEAPIKAGCSGGMYSATELAIDLAVATVVSRRTGVVPAWIILDESFEGLGPVEKEGCLEILKVYASDKLILIVDHASEVKGAFETTIDVEFKNGISTIRYGEETNPEK